MSWLSSALKVTTSLLPAHLMIFWSEASDIPRDLFSQSNDGVSWKSSESDYSTKRDRHRGRVGSSCRRPSLHVAVTPVVAKASGIEVKRNESDVRVVHGLEFLYMARAAGE
jgi:hypothetical protein